MNINVDIPWLRDVPLDELRRIVDAVYRVHHLISVITDLDTLLESIIEESKQVARAEACSLLLYDAKAGQLYFHIARGETGDQQALKREVCLKLDEGVAGVAASTRQSINVEDVGKDPRFYSMADEISHFKTRSLLAVPLVDRDTLIGVIEVVNKIGGTAFTDADLHVMEMFSSLAATSISNARLIEDNLKTERLAAIGQAVSGLSHYTKNIVTGMMGSAELIDQGLTRNDVDLLRRCWPILKRSTNRISDFVQDMLAFSKPREPVYETCLVRDLINEVAQTYSGLLANRKVSIEVNTDAAEKPIALDTGGVYRAMLNVFSNAGEAVPAETGRICVRALMDENGNLVIEVEDNGPGVPEENRSQIFEPFFSTKGSHGTGLGLAVTQKIVQEHGGNITVETARSGGALFRLTFPQPRVE